MSERRSIRNEIIASAVGGLLVVFILWIIGKLPATLKWIAALLTSQIGVPVWLLLTVAIAAIFALRYARRKRSLQLQVEEPHLLSVEPRAQQAIQLPAKGSLEMQIVEQLVRADASMEVRDLGYVIAVPMLRVQQAVERLHDAGIVQVHRNYIHGPAISFTRAGRDAALSM